MPASKGGERSSWTNLKPNGSTGYATLGSILGSEFDSISAKDQKSVQPNARSGRRKIFRIEMKPDIQRASAMRVADSQQQKYDARNFTAVGGISDDGLSSGPLTAGTPGLTSTAQRPHQKQSSHGRVNPCALLQRK
jgi:hypothetical protein